MNLYMLINDGGDGSYYPVFIVDREVLKEIEKLSDQGFWDFENGFGCDGDGFHYTTLKVPEDSTPESLGLSAGSFYDKGDLERWKENYLNR